MIVAKCEHDGGGWCRYEGGNGSGDGDDDGDEVDDVDEDGDGCIVAPKILFIFLAYISASIPHYCG